MPNVQIFGVKNSQETRAAERFFKERRVPMQIVDLKQKPIAAGEIKRFLDRYGWDGLLDVAGKPYVDGGLQYLKLTDDQRMQRIAREPKLLRLPLVRCGAAIAVGRDEAAWKAMLAG
jgi:arsenate reductase-like glutaredoxin family protein